MPPAFALSQDQTLRFITSSPTQTHRAQRRRQHNKQKANPNTKTNQPIQPITSQRRPKSNQPISPTSRSTQTQTQNQPTNPTHTNPHNPPHPNNPSRTNYRTKRRRQLIPSKTDTIVKEQQPNRDATRIRGPASQSTWLAPPQRRPRKLLEALDGSKRASIAESGI